MSYTACFRVSLATAIAWLMTASLLTVEPRPLLAQAPQSPPPAQPTFRIDASFVRVDVYPTLRGQAIQDLRLEDFDVLEDGAPQRIEAFEHIVVPPAGPQSSRVEPSSVRESNDLASNPRSRVFVLFLDTYHVEREASYNVKQPLVRLIDRIIGQEDLVGLMTPEMSAANVTLARKTNTIIEFLENSWNWGRRSDINRSRDPKEELYETCYPGNPEIAAEMIARRREKMSLDALEDLVKHLRGLRDERKAILVVTDGWLLYRRNGRLSRPLAGDPIPSGPPIAIGPGGKLTTFDKGTTSQPSLAECDGDRLRLAEIDHDQQFRDIIEEANRSNASFYPVDPRGLPVFDSPIGPDPPLPITVDRAQLGARLTTMRTLAEQTDGMAVVESNDIESGLKRIATDLSSYYLLGYYSTNAKLDGRYRTIKVRVKRPGVDVRARRGYRAATAEEVRPQRTPTSRGITTPAAVSAPVTAALGTLAGTRPGGTALRVRATTAWKAIEAASPAVPSNGSAPVVWVVGEIDPRAAGDGWLAGGGVQIGLEDAAGVSVATRELTLEARSRSFAVALPVADLKPGDYTVRVRAKAGGGQSVFEAASVVVPDHRDAKSGPFGDSLYFRRGPTTGPQYQPTADLRFRRTERVRVEASVSSAFDSATAQFLDRNGHAMALPLMATTRQDPDGTRWVVSELALTPLAPGDYLIQFVVKQQEREQKVLAAIKIVP